MSNQNISLVVFSTLNQITNYLAVRYLDKKYNKDGGINFKNIYSIDYKEDEQFNSNIKPQEWFLNFEKVLKENNKNTVLNLQKWSIIDNTSCLENILEDFEDELEDRIEEISEDKIFWNITGGQRIYAFKIIELLKKLKRDKDVVFYLEGNTNKTIIYPIGENVFEDNIELKDVDLDIQTTFTLMGFKTKELDSSNFIDIKDVALRTKKTEEDVFYENLCKKYIKENNKIEFEYINPENKKKYQVAGTLMELLVISNRLKEDRQNFLKEVYNNLKFSNYNPSKDDEFIKEVFCLNQEKIAGYIFEKIVSTIIREKVEVKFKNIIRMGTSIKSYQTDSKKEAKGKSVDELDIVLLSESGKILNIECKSGAMSGDNAKSTNYTTYALSGAFGVPILLVPIKTFEEYKKIEGQDNIYNFYEEDKNRVEKAIKAAERAGLLCFSIEEAYNSDEFENILKNL